MQYQFSLRTTKVKKRLNKKPLTVFKKQVAKREKKKRRITQKNESSGDKLEQHVSETQQQQPDQVFWKESDDNLFELGSRTDSQKSSNSIDFEISCEPQKVSGTFPGQPVFRETKMRRRRTVRVSDQADFVDDRTEHSTDQHDSVIDDTDNATDQSNDIIDETDLANNLIDQVTDGIDHVMDQVDVAKDRRNASCECRECRILEKIRIAFHKIRKSVRENKPCEEFPSLLRVTARPHRAKLKIIDTDCDFGAGEDLTKTDILLTVNYYSSYPARVYWCFENIFILPENSVIEQKVVETEKRNMYTATLKFKDFTSEFAGNYYFLIRNAPALEWSYFQINNA